jgi:short-subunit dehydrogenase
MERRIALVTGGSSGIGRSLCLKLAKEGYQVFSASRSKILPNDMAEITQISVDFSSPERSSAFAQNFIDQYGIPDLLVNNAGYGAFYEWGEFPDSEINKQIEVLFSAPARLCRIFAPAMAEQSGGVIVNLSSLAILYPLPFMPIYNAGKAALSSFSQTLMLEYNHSPAIIDFRMGDVHTDFNCSASKQENLSEKTKSAWFQIDKQLQASISPDQAAQQILLRIQSPKSGTYFGGGWYHAQFLPIVDRFIPTKMKNYFIRICYK